MTEILLLGYWNLKTFIDSNFWNLGRFSFNATWIRSGIFLKKLPQGISSVLWNSPCFSKTDKFKFVLEINWDVAQKNWTAVIYSSLYIWFQIFLFLFFQWKRKKALWNAFKEDACIRKPGQWTVNMKSNIFKACVGKVAAVHFLAVLGSTCSIVQQIG